MSTCYPGVKGSFQGFGRNSKLNVTRCVTSAGSTITFTYFFIGTKANDEVDLVEIHEARMIMVYFVLVNFTKSTLL